jgi:methenyltetrahydromethanopterin cyclohydrolase
MDSTGPRPSVNARAMRLVDRLVRDADALRLSVTTDFGARMVDAGAAMPGSIEAGRRIAAICMGGLGRVSIVPVGPVPSWPFSIQVQASDPVLACLGSQYAGWSLTDKAAGGTYFALGSGPGRAAAGVEPLLAELGYHDQAERIVLVLESAAAPPAAVIETVASATGLAPDAITFIYAPTQSLAGSTQVVARVLEVALHKAHTLGFPLAQILDGMGSAPLAPPAPEFVKAMGRTNDAIIYGSRVQLFVDADDAAARSLAEQLPSSASRDHGEPFANIFARAGGHFYAIDPHLFSPAEVIITSLKSGVSHRGGRIDAGLVEASFA